MWDQWWERHGQRELRCILMVAWDPIGVGNVPEAWDEYDDYLEGVAVRLRDAADEIEAADSVGDYLGHVARDLMELPAPPEHLADSLVAWHEWSFRCQGRPPAEWIDD